MCRAVTSGKRAEQVVADYLREQGYDVIGCNWRTRWCEIDIVAKKSQIIYFVEVKYRRSELYGSGLEYITNSKLKQMRLAAEIWISAHGWQGDYEIAAIEVTGAKFKITEAIFGLDA